MNSCKIGFDDERKTKFRKSRDQEAKTVSVSLLYIATHTQHKRDTIEGRKDVLSRSEKHRSVYIKLPAFDSL